MFRDFETYLTSRAAFSEDDFDLIRSLSTEKKVRRKQFLLAEGEICRYKIFVCKGLLRNYRVREDGTEHIVRFVAENEWTTEPESYNSQTPTEYNIEALEDTEVIVWTHETLSKIVAAVPAFRSFLVQLQAQSLGAIQNHIFKQVSYTAEEKYLDFINSYPNVFGRVPLEMVASYLGLSRKTLTRVRHAQLNPLSQSSKPN
jgi:CRP-like cAMP-binding protein